MKLRTLAILFSLISSSLPAYSATPQFENVIQSIESSQLRHIGKFDNDAFPDLLLAYQDRIFYRKGDGKGNFSAPLESTLADQLYNGTNTAVGDLTGDQIDDFVYVNGTVVKIYQGSSSGTFSLFRSVVLNFSVSKPIIGHFNSDNYLDLLISGASTWTSNFFFEGGPSGLNPSFSEYKQGFYPNGMWCEVSQAAKISPTGSAALLCIGNSSIGIIPMIAATQPGQMNAYTSLYTWFPNDRDYAIADLNGDGLLDLVAIRSDPPSSKLQIFENSNLGLNSPINVTSTAISWQDRLFLSDIDGDMRIDIVLFTPNGKTLYSLNLGALKFQSFQSISNSISNENLTVSDINGDAIGDFLFSGNNRLTVLLTKNAVRLEAEAKAAAELKAKQEAEAKAAAELKAKQEIEAKAAAELKAKQEAESAAEKIIADAKAEAERIVADARAQVAPIKKATITCVKGKTVKKITALKPKCPRGYKVKA